MTIDSETESETAIQPIEVFSITEAARRMSACSNTLRRAIDRSNIVADAIMIQGSNRVRSKLFVAARFDQLKKLINL